MNASSLKVMMDAYLVHYIPTSDSNLIEKAELLVQDEMLRENRDRSTPLQRCFIVTEKGRVFVNALMSVPMPIVVYTMPGKK